MDLDLSPEHRLLRDTVRKFMVEEVAPLVDEHERERRFPIGVVRRIGELGWLGIPIPEDEGGAGLDTLAYAIAVEEIGRVWGSLGLIVAAHTSLGCGPLHLAGTPEQQQRYLVPMASGHVIGAYGLTEPGAGSDSGGTRTVARLEVGPDGGSWVIDGGKRFITNAGQAGTYVVTARTGERLDGTAEISAFIVPADTPGFSVGRLEEKLGLHASATGELVFDNCEVPRENMLGQEGGGLGVALKTVSETGRTGMAATALGILQACYEEAAKFANERVLYGKPISSLQAISFSAAEIYMELDICRLLCYRASWMKDQNMRFDTESAMAKSYTCDAAARCAKKAIEIHGAYGILKEYKVQRLLRDAMVTISAGGTGEIGKVVIGRAALAPFQKKK